MTRLIIAALCILLWHSSNAQADKWKIIFNKKTVIQTSEEDTAKNVIQFKKKDLTNSSICKIIFEEDPNGIKGWKRSIALYDTKGEPVMQMDSTQQLFFYNNDLLKLMWTRKKLMAYTWSAPNDPKMAAAIRIRRKHLCTFVLLED